jgi:hypothetical protein
MSPHTAGGLPPPALAQSTRRPRAADTSPPLSRNPADTPANALKNRSKIAHAEKPKP